MPDITVCVNQYCPLRLVCYRFTVKHKEQGQSMANYSYMSKGTAWYCEHYIPIKFTNK